MHWHKTAEWAYILSVGASSLSYKIQLILLQGNTQITAINPDGQNFLATLVGQNAFVHH